MKTLWRFWERGRDGLNGQNGRNGQRSFLLANEAASVEVTLVNEAPMNGEWVQLAPYGDHKHSRGVQRFQKVDADAIVKDFQSLINTPQRLLGLPWYVGHPDHEAFKDRYRDTRAYGRIKKLEAREDGLYANVKFSEEGKRMIADEAFLGPSVNWRAREESNGVFRPYSLKSVGFTNEPNIPVKSLTNEDDGMALKNNLIKKFKLAEDATDEQIEAAVNAADTALANEKTARKNELANERKSRAALLIAAGITAGKILLAEKTQWEEDFANEFEETESKLAAAKKKIKTESVTEGLGRGSLDRSASTGRKKVLELVNERIKATGEDYETAFCAVKNGNAPLFEAMHQPKRD